MNKYFDHIIFTGSHGINWVKPSMLPFLELMKRERVLAKECIYIADNPRKDFLGPNMLGWLTIRVRNNEGLYYHELPLQGGEPDITVDNLDGVFKNFRSWDLL
jgi:putative hydrolase of the HAD superfamily